MDSGWRPREFADAIRGERPDLILLRTFRDAIIAWRHGGMGAGNNPIRYVVRAVAPVSQVQLGSIDMSGVMLSLGR